MWEEEKRWTLADNLDEWNLQEPVENDAYCDVRVSREDWFKSQNHKKFQKPNPFSRFI